MTSLSGWHIAGAILILLCSAVAESIPNGDPPPFDVDQWLRGPDREDFSWDIFVSMPYLTLDQRYRVQVSASIDFKEEAAQRDLHFFLNVATADKRGISNNFYKQVPVQPDFENSEKIRAISGILLSPGRYTISIIVYDAIIKEGNISRKRVTVPGQKKDRLAELDRDLPDIEFTPDIPASALPGGIDLDWPSNTERWLQVKNGRPLCLDIVVNTSVDDFGDIFPFPEAIPFHNVRINIPQLSYEPRKRYSRILQMASILSRLMLDSGCVRVSILDSQRLHTFFDREDAARFDWRNANDTVARQDRYTIDANVLGSQTKASAYLLEQLNRILRDDSCAPGTEQASRVVIIVSKEVLFADNTPIHEVAAPDPASNHFYHFCVSDYRGRWGDDLGKMLKQTNPRKFVVMNPLTFRKALTSLISNLEELN